MIQHLETEEDKENTRTASSLSQRPVLESLEDGTLLCLAG